MATLKTQVSSTRERREVGQRVLAAAAVVDTKPVRARLAEFARSHKAFVTAADKVLAAELVRDAAHAAVAAADVEQDAALEALCTALVTAGAARTTPLKGLSNYAPSNLRELAVAKESKEIVKITAAIVKRGGMSPALRRATKAASDAAAAVQRTIVSVGPREKLYQEAIAARDALSQPWETALAFLKRAAQVAEDGGAKGLFAALFQRTAPAAKAKGKAKPKTP